VPKNVQLLGDETMAELRPFILYAIDLSHSEIHSQYCSNFKTQVDLSTFHLAH
jgi:hypothetical protein